MSFQDILTILCNTKFNQSEYEKIASICNKKINEMSNDYYKNEMYKLLNNIDNNLKTFIHSINKVIFFEKLNDHFKSYNIIFNYNHFNITLSYKIAFCSEFGGISKENYINIIDTHQETCYNLWGSNMISRFINLLNLESNENEVKEMLTLMFQVYESSENIIF